MLQASLRDSSERVAQVAQRIFLPAFAMWAAEISRLDTELVQKFVDKLEDLVKVRFFCRFFFILINIFKSGNAAMNAGLDLNEADVQVLTCVPKPNSHWFDINQRRKKREFYSGNDIFLDILLFLFHMYTFNSPVK